MRWTSTILFALFAASPLLRADGGFQYDADSQRWDLSNGVIHAVFQLGQDGKFLFKEIDDLAGGHVWSAPDNVPTSPIRFRFNSSTYDASTAFRLISQQADAPDSRTSRATIVLQDVNGRVQVSLELEMFTGQQVLRHRVSVTNLTLRKVYAEMADLEPYNFVDLGRSYRLWRVNQWSVSPKPTDFQASEISLNQNGTPVTITSGASGIYCAWFAVADDNSRGIFAGWEFDGTASATVRDLTSDGYVQLSAPISSLYHPVNPGEVFCIPAAFIGLFQGGWDEAGYRTQQFSETALAKTAPADFPYVAWDSWGYKTNIDEATLRMNAQIAAKLGIELFIVDLGWAKQIGNWTEDLQKFPNGLRALSDYVHSLGMKFGLHFALAEAAPDSPVLQANPDWASSESYNYFGALSLCLSNKPTRDWLVQQTVNMIDNYNVDWILQDGQTMVKHCTKTTHSHDSRDSNYANSVQGLNAVIEEVQRQRPAVLWENCEDGGTMMTFNMVSHYVTSITNDASGALGSRQGVFGATYPFSSRFADRYEPEDPGSSYITRSYMFGGPWHFMTQLPAMSDDSAAFASSEIQTYKSIRAHIRGGQIFHLTAPPASGRIDALESYLASDDTAIAVVTNDGSVAKYADIKLQGLRPGNTYQVHFQDDTRVLSMTGDQLMSGGVRVFFPQSQAAEIVYVAPGS